MHLHVLALLQQWLMVQAANAYWPSKGISQFIKKNCQGPILVDWDVYPRAKTFFLNADPKLFHKRTDLYKKIEITIALAYGVQWGFPKGACHCLDHFFVWDICFYNLIPNSRIVTIQLGGVIDFYSLEQNTFILIIRQGCLEYDQVLDEIRLESL